jgi:alanine transaminase
MESAKNLFPRDAIARAAELYSEIGSIGAYSHSQGVPFIRKNVAAFIEGETPKRDISPLGVILTATPHSQPVMASPPIPTTFS